MNHAPVNTGILPVTPYQQNCSLVWCPASMKGAVIDPGGELPRIEHAIAAKGVTVEKVLLTHGHMDHAGGAAALAQKLGVPIEGPNPGDRFLLDSLAEQGARFGIPDAENCAPDRWLEDGEEVRVGEAVLGVRHCPGHTPGHVVFYNQAAKLAFVGDVLFKGSIGRTDLPGGNFEQLINSITQRLWPLGDDMRFVPGHGETSTFGFERKTNPFVADAVLGG
ncbi:MAG: MBL fold metallo-hydrolase [Alphaproteobacteria bacterium]|nr:MBL fold metallo-hydrolase [Alphaproteobacteria bacterium]MBU6471633.1 MBL fold metallo-hydrolase [Alphaproteobacteria bacterium]MDE2014653.1 MBL fold metallo-hydrolase [Alphaproteobacteria bacterium]MDE2073875.1 MBL fold metallo-hydrolase [Alphaproteobacteria bacterium]MDE2351057.1 MBL fold metallo-hydrolase [Alphaproteobacteria bacterium]